jgi:hypothetical protein
MKMDLRQAICPQQLIPLAQMVFVFELYFMKRLFYFVYHFKAGSGVALNDDGNGVSMDDPIATVDVARSDGNFSLDYKILRGFLL